MELWRSEVADADGPGGTWREIEINEDVGFGRRGCRDGEELTRIKVVLGLYTL